MRILNWVAALAQPIKKEFTSLCPLRKPLRSLWLIFKTMCSNQKQNIPTPKAQTETIFQPSSKLTLAKF